MRNNDFYDFGEQIQKLVQSAIDSNDFRQLNESVRQTVNDAVDAVRSGVSQASDSIAKRRQAEAKKGQNGERKATVKTPSSYSSRERAQNQYYAAHPSGEIVGTLLSVFGFLVATFAGIGLVVLGIMVYVLDGLAALMLPTVILLVLFILLMLVGLKGRGMTLRVKRFRNYRRILDDREFCDIEELASATGRSKAYVLKDVKDMIKRGLFRQGHLDQQESCLMVTDSAYRQYAQAQKGLEEREAQAKAQKAKREDPKYSKEVRDMLIEGDRYVKHIRACNEAIPDIEISGKISRLELIVSRIFGQVEKDPSLAPELHRFMNYYLPTTQKLLDVYKELDHQPVQGQHISETKREIEATLDTINQAFEKLLDSCYKDTAWDVSTDISVLQTMLAKEGLTNDSIGQTR